MCHCPEIHRSRRLKHPSKSCRRGGRPAGGVHRRCLTACGPEPHERGDCGDRHDAAAAAKWTGQNLPACLDGRGQILGVQFVEAVPSALATRLLLRELRQYAPFSPATAVRSRRSGGDKTRQAFLLVNVESQRFAVGSEVLETPRSDDRGGCVRTRHHPRRAMLDGETPPPWAVPWVWLSRTTTPAFPRRFGHNRPKSTGMPGRDRRSRSVSSTSRSHHPCQVVATFSVRFVTSVHGCSKRFRVVGLCRPGSTCPVLGRDTRWRDHVQLRYDRRRPN